MRDVYEVGEHLLLVATDRISAFDCILPTPIPNKGRVLTSLSRFWFERLSDIVENHLVSTDVEAFPEVLHPFAGTLEGRSMLCRRAEVVPVECVVRAYLIGTGWKDYLETGAVCGIELPPGLRIADRLPEPIFTPATKEAMGAHDVNVSEARMAELVGADLTRRLRETALEIYRRAVAHAAACGIIIADTKFEFGRIGDAVILIDECLTPDSSRFWPVETYAPGTSPESFDKQFVRDYLETLDWDKRPPAPPLPDDVVARTSAKYLEAYRLLTGRDLVTS